MRIENKSINIETNIQQTVTRTKHVLYFSKCI